MTISVLDSPLPQDFTYKTTSMSVEMKEISTG